MAISAYALFQADYQYFHTNFGPQSPYPTGGRANLKDCPPEHRSAVSHGKHRSLPPPVAYTCTAAPSPAFPGDPVTVTGTASNLNPKKTPPIAGLVARVSRLPATAMSANRYPAALLLATTL